MNHSTDDLAGARMISDLNLNPESGVLPASIPVIASTARILKLALPGMLLAAVCLLPFLDKAYTIDDPIFMLEARQILKTPLQPMSFPTCWTDNALCVARTGQFGTGQGLMGYLLVPAALAGGAEWVSHLTQLLLGWLAVLAMVRLALRLGFRSAQAAAAGLMLVAIPPFLSMASTALPDVAALALGLNGIERLLAWRQEQRWHQAAIASLALGLAGYARVHLLLLIPLGALWLVFGPPDTALRFQNALTGWRRLAYLWMPLFFASCILAAVNLVTRDPGPNNLVRDLDIGPHNVPSNLFAYLVYFSFPIPLALVWVGVRLRPVLLAVILPLLAVLVYHFTIAPQRSIYQEWSTVAAAYGLVVLVHILYRSVRDRDRLGMLLWLWLLLPLPAVFYHHLPIKYLVPVMPAVVLLLVRALADLPDRWALNCCGALVVICTAYSCVLLKADADAADCARQAAADLIAVPVASGEKVWFSGQWGFYWYALEAGAQVAHPGGPGPKPGELLAIGWMEAGFRCSTNTPIASCSTP